MSQTFDKAGSVLRDIALKAIEPETGKLRAEYIEALAKANNDIDSKLDAMRLDIAKQKAEERLNTVTEAKARKNAVNPVLRGFLKNTPVDSALMTKASEHVRFDAASAGVLLAQPEMANEINRLILDITPVLQVVDVQDIGVAKLDVPVQTSNIEAYWEDETEASTDGKDAFKSISVTPFELRARTSFSQSMLDDSQYDLEGYLMTSISERMAQKIGEAIMEGNGVNKPLSLVDNVSSYASGALALSFNQIIALTGQPIEGYLKTNPESTGYMMNRATRQLVRALAISSTAVQYAWEVDGRLGNPERLLGSPVFVAANADMVSPSAAGAFTTDQKPILFGNFKRAYTVARRNEIKIIRDPYTGASRFVVYVNVMQRIDGRVTNANAVFALKASGS
jgi:HK97 family phage major capsid protein